MKQSRCCASSVFFHKLLHTALQIKNKAEKPVGVNSIAFLLKKITERLISQPMLALWKRLEQSVKGNNGVPQKNKGFSSLQEHAIQFRASPKTVLQQHMKHL